MNTERIMLNHNLKEDNFLGGSMNIVQGCNFLLIWLNIGIKCGILNLNFKVQIFSMLLAQYFLDM